MSETPPQAYISKVHLKGYKSIKDLEIDFKPGLNIIIGPNGSGKTNFLEFTMWRWRPSFLNSAPNLTKPFTNIIETKFYKRNTSDVVSHVYEGARKLQNNKTVFETKEWIEENGQETVIRTMTNDFKNLSIQMAGIDRGFSFNGDEVSIVRFENSIKSFLLKAMTVEVEEEDFYGDIVVLGDIDQESKIEAEEIVLNCFRSLKKINRKNLKKHLTISKELVRNLQRYSPIQNIVFDIAAVRQTNETRLDNIFFKFFINEEWLEWKDLSDGTKRIFEIIVCILNKENKVIFLEEPELGIHPDQLYDLMDFLQAQAKEKQIIITTHSPEVMNILNKDELDRIIVTRYDNEKGTQMHHLSEKKIRKAIRYMSTEGLSIKDFWVHSNLEELDEED